jgi:hypothetical protein
MILTDWQYRLFASYTFYKALNCNALAEVFRKQLIEELENG